MDSRLTREKGLFHKSAFDYHPQTDTYHCPAGQTLILLGKCEKTPRTRVRFVVIFELL